MPICADLRYFNAIMPHGRTQETCQKEQEVRDACFGGTVRKERGRFSVLL